MIRYLELRNWRAFNKVALHLSEGTTFVVAENGIGKTSLLRGAAWTLFAPRQVDPRLELRQGDGAGETAGLVVMSTAEGDLEIERTYRVGGRPANTLRATLAGVAIDPDHLDATLTRLMGARPDIACELGFVHQHTLATDQALFSNVGQLLRRLTGVEQLQSVRGVMFKAQRRHDKAARELTKTASVQKTARDELVNEVANSDDVVTAIEHEERSALERLQLANRRFAIHQQWARYDLDVEAHQQLASALDAEIEAELASQTLENAIDLASTEQSQVTDQHAHQLATQHLHERLAGQLGDAEAICPVCRQDIDSFQAALAAIIALVIKTGRRDALAWIHAGWIAAVVLGILTWFVARTVISISGANREMTEGVTALLAAAMLLYVGYWLHNKSNTKAWQHFIREKVDSALGKGTLWTLAGISFLAVYRELFEIILFYETLLSQAGPAGQQAVLGGIGAAAILLAVIGGAILKFSVRLPIGPFFAATAGLLALMAVVFTGNGVAALQEAGVLHATMVRFISVPLLGIHATLQGLIMQGIVMALVIGGVLLGRWRMARETHKA